MCRPDGMQEHRFVGTPFRGSIISSFYIDPIKAPRKVFICGVSVAPNMSLVLSELSARIEIEMGEFEWMGI
jgi:hypothetical protein